MASVRLERLVEGMAVPFGGDRAAIVSAELAAAFAPGDRLHVVQASGDLLHIPAEVHRQVTQCVDAAAAAFADLRVCGAQSVTGFFAAFADRLADEQVWAQIVQANGADVASARQRGRSVTRLQVSERMRTDMIAGLRGWIARGGASDASLAQRVDHPGWSVEVHRAPLGVVGFVFEGRPNVFADAAGVVATGNVAVLRIGQDALGTARAIEHHALRPALEQSGLPQGTVGLIPTPERSAGWALFSDPRLALAVVRGSGAAVLQLGSVARQSGIAVSAHGTGGAWLVADPTADAERLAGAVRHSLDRKVCNTLNVAVILGQDAERLVPIVRAAADAASPDGAARIHLAEGSDRWIPAAERDHIIDVRRAEGVVREPRVTPIPIEALGTEWEWEQTPELSLVVVDDLDAAIDLFNARSPRFVATLISSDPRAHARFRAGVDAPFVGDGFTRWVDGQYALDQPELGLSNWEGGRLLGRAAVLTGADLTTRRVIAHHDRPDQRR